MNWSAAHGPQCAHMAGVLRASFEVAQEEQS
jgi:hypothetical protein